MEKQRNNNMVKETNWPAADLSPDGNCPPAQTYCQTLMVQRPVSFREGEICRWFVFLFLLVSDSSFKIPRLRSQLTPPCMAFQRNGSIDTRLGRSMLVGQAALIGSLARPPVARLLTCLLSSVRLLT